MNESENEIFAILSGEYSDWNIEGYTDSEDKAMQICAVHNKENKHDDWYYAEVKKMENPIRTIELKYVHEVVFDKNMEAWQMMQDPYRYKYFESGDKDIPEHSKIDYWTYTDRIIVATIPMKENNRKKAEKIAQDMLYQFLAMQPPRPHD